jgi:hypothetical protein
MEGIVIGLYNIKNMGMEVVEQVHVHTENAIKKDWKNVWSHGVSTVKLEFLQKTYDVISEGLFKHPSQLRWVLRTHLCNFVVDKTFPEDADSGFIIQKYLDDEGAKMLLDLEHNQDDEVNDGEINDREINDQEFNGGQANGGQVNGGKINDDEIDDASDDGFGQYNENGQNSSNDPPSDYKGFMPKEVKDEMSLNPPPSNNKRSMPKNVKDETIPNDQPNDRPSNQPSDYKGFMPKSVKDEMNNQNYKVIFTSFLIN